MAEIIQLTEKSRLRVEQDSDATSPRDSWDMLTGFRHLADMGDSRRMRPTGVHRAPFSLCKLYYKLQARRPFAGYTDIIYRRRQEDIDTIARLARMFYGLLVVWDHDHGGWWFVDLAKCRENFGVAADAQISLEDQAAIIQREREIYEQWASGDVYGVVLERLTTWARIDENGEMVFLTEPHTKTLWEEVDDGALWGCYLDDEYTAQAVALENFPLADDEAAGARGQFPAGDLPDEVAAAQ